MIIPLSGYDGVNDIDGSVFLATGCTTNMTTTDVCGFPVLFRDLSNNIALQPAHPVEAAEAAMDLIPIGMDPLIKSALT